MARKETVLHLRVTVRTPEGFDVSDDAIVEHLANLAKDFEQNSELFGGDAEDWAIEDIIKETTSA